MLRPFATALVISLLFACGPTPKEKLAEQRQPKGWDDAFSAPLAEDLSSDDKTLEVRLEAKLATLELLPGKQTQVWTYNGGIPGPLLRAKRGDKLIVHFTNNLPEPTTIHWHGVRVPAAMDGAGAHGSAIAPGESFRYEFELLDSGTFWYHPHVRSSAQVGFGLYGALLVDDGEDLGDDVVMVLSDIGISEDGTLVPGDVSGWFGDYFGRAGDTLLVNGRLNPTIKARVGAPQRWHIINAARSRYFLFNVPGQKLIRIGGDGGLIAHPVGVSELRLAPGERAELFIRPVAIEGGSIIVQSRDADAFHVGSTLPPEDLFTLEVTGDKPWTAFPPIAQTLRTIQPIDTTNAITRTLELTEQPGTAGGQPTLGINGKPASAMEMLHAQVGTTEVWTVRNTTDYDHPFHLHGFFFQVLELGGKAPAVAEWKDTVNVPHQQTLRFAVTYDNRPGDWMFHCHILDHADLGMMAVLMVMP